MNAQFIMDHYKSLYDATDENWKAIKYLTEKFEVIVKISYVHIPSSNLATVTFVLNNKAQQKFTLDLNKNYSMDHLYTQYHLDNYKTDHEPNEYFYWIFVETLQDIVHLMDNLEEFEFICNTGLIATKFDKHIKSLRKLSTNLFDMFEKESLCGIEDIKIICEYPYDSKYDFWGDEYGVNDILEKLPLSIKKLEIPMFDVCVHGPIDENNKEAAQLLVALPHLEFKNIIFKGIKGTGYTVDCIKKEYDILLGEHL